MCYNKLNKERERYKKMTTKFIVKVGFYTDVNYGYGNNWVAIEEKFNTIEAAKKYCADNAEKTMTKSGDMIIVKKTIDEATFTVEEETVFTYDYFHAVEILKPIKALADNIAECEAKISRAKSAKTISRLTKEVETYRARKENYERKHNEFIATL